MKSLIILWSVALSLLSAHCSEEELSSKEQTEGLITNGQPAEPNQFPYQALLTIDETYSCGGTLISEEWILTAAHCLEDAIEIKVTLGTIYIDGRDGTTETTTTYFIHENYDPSLTANDIGLIKLESPVELSESIKPASLPGASEEGASFEGSYAIASGWGQLSTNYTDLTVILQYINVPVISKEECEKVYSIWFSDSMICIATAPENTSTCFGDSGGPLVLSNSNTLIGITSFGSSSGCELGYPVVFTRVSSYLDWIAGISGIST